jgi:RNA polymerase sigma-70 factor, ECF subfamily
MATARFAIMYPVRPATATPDDQAHAAPGVRIDGEASIELVRQACRGDREAENALCARYLPRLHRWTRGRLPQAVRPALETGDVVQDVLLNAIRTFPQFEPRHEGAFAAYLRTILANRLLDLGRRAIRRPAPASIEDCEPASREASPFDLALSREQRERFEAGLRTLAPADQELIFMRIELGCPYEEMATMLGRSNANALRVATRRALVRLAAAMARDGGPRPDVA